jgi:uncharacterized protein HemX
MAKRKSGGARGGGGRSRKGKSISPSSLLLVVCLAGLGVALYLLYQEKQRNREQVTPEQQAAELLKENPDAEAFNLEESDKSGEKKNIP